MSRTAIALFVEILLGAAGARLYVPSSEATSEEQAEPETPVTLPDLPEPYYKVLFENDAVRIVDHRLAPGEREPEHTHAPMVGYFVQGATGDGYRSRRLHLGGDPPDRPVRRGGQSHVVDAFTGEHGGHSPPLHPGRVQERAAETLNGCDSVQTMGWG